MNSPKNFHLENNGHKLTAHISHFDIESLSIEIKSPDNKKAEINISLDEKGVLKAHIYSHRCRDSDIITLWEDSDFYSMVDSYIK